jgi:hypothetical protein
MTPSAAPLQSEPTPQGEQTLIPAFVPFACVSALLC